MGQGPRTAPHPGELGPVCQGQAVSRAGFLKEQRLSVCDLLKVGPGKSSGGNSENFFSEKMKYSTVIPMKGKAMSNLKNPFCSGPAEM